MKNGPIDAGRENGSCLRRQDCPPNLPEEPVLKKTSLTVFNITGKLHWFTKKGFSMNKIVREAKKNLSAVGRAGLVGVLMTGAWVSGGTTVLASERSAVLEEVVVTARKRDESIQDVPVSVTSIGKELKESTVRRLEDIQNFAPNIAIRRSPGIASGANISIRGVSTLDSDKSLDPAIGVMMDGMFLGTSSGVLLQNFDIKRIEVLRGPQGTLFGKNTTGGIINVIRGDVTMQTGADISVTMDGNGREDVKAVVNLPIVADELGIKLFAAQVKSDGFVYNTTLQEDVGGDDIQTYGFTTLWEPSDVFNLKLHYERFNDASDQGSYVNVNQPGELTCSLSGLPWNGQVGCEADSSDGPDQNSADGRNDSDNAYETFIVTANLDLDDWLVTYIATSRDMDEDNMQHFDGAPMKFLTMRFYNDWHQKSQEFRITSQFSDNVDIIAGLYLWDVDYVQRWDVGDLHYQLSRIGAYPGPLTPTSLNSNGQEQVTESLAVFYSMDWHLNEQWTVTAGVRWTEEEKVFLGGNGGVPYDPAAGDPIPALLDPVSYQNKWNSVTPKVGVRYALNDDLMIFASYSEGFKSGGFFGRQANFNLDASYDPEFVENFEIGMKSTWMDGKVIFNPAVFWSKYKDKQESILIPVSLSNVATVVRNASSVDIFGAELELQYQINEAWYVRATYGYINAEYNAYLADITGDQIVTDNSGLSPRNTPEGTMGLTTTYTVPVGTGDVKAMLSYRWRDSVETIATNDPLGTLPSISDISASVSYAWSDERYRITAFGRNITDEREKQVARISPLTTRGYWNEGATYGVELSASF